LDPEWLLGVETAVRRRSNASRRFPPSTTTRTISRLSLFSISTRLLTHCRHIYYSREYEIFVEKRGIVIIVFTAFGAVEYAILAEVINEICFLAAF
jgi:hypothetical protein